MKQHDLEKKRKIRQKALEFLIWRIGQSVDWDCTNKEIAKEAGISRAHVAIICKRKGWKSCRSIENNVRDNIGVDTLMKSQYPEWFT